MYPISEFIDHSGRLLIEKIFQFCVAFKELHGDYPAGLLF